MCGFLKKEDLIKFYQNQKLSCVKVANILKCGNSTVKKYLKKYNIPRRKRKEYPYFTKEKSYHWRGGISKHQRGYILRFMPNHPNCNQRGYVFEHRLIMEKQIGRYLHKWEIVHHINKILDDNRIENLKLFPSQSMHISQHFKKIILILVSFGITWLLKDKLYSFPIPLFALCGFYGHGFYEPKTKEVIFDFEINSHSKIKEYRQIPAEAIACGFNPIDGIACTNSGEELSQEVKEKIELMFQAYFPNKETIVEWIRKNYGVMNDKKEWNEKFVFMLSIEGIAKWLGKKRCKAKAEWCKAKAEWYNSEAEWYNSKAEWYNSKAEWYNSEAEWCNSEAKRCKSAAERYESAADIAEDFEFSENNFLENFISVFLKYPNDYWANKTEERKIEYQSFVKV